jgi:putative IMPACT (imprinted ancient) family translation regulator
LEITPEHFKLSDEGEPANTAGKPILAQIQGHELHNILIVVTRYFGGTMLGIGGLIQAYGDCAKQVIEHGKIIQQEITKVITFSYNFDLVPIVRNVVNKFNAKIVNEKYNKEVECEISINT